MTQHLPSQGTVMTGARQTMTAWSRVIETRDEIPAFYRSSFDDYFGSAQPFPHVVWTPALEKFRRRTTEKLVVVTDEAIHIFERKKNQLQVRGYAYRDICSVELGIVLLESWLTIQGTTTRGEAGASTIEFNTTSMRYFESALKKMRPSLPAADPAQAAAEKDKFDVLAESNFKFMNYGRQSLVAGETVLQFLLQPEIRQPVLTVFGRTFYKLISPAHLTILTDRELILLRDDERVKASHLDRYGGIWQFIPLQRINAVTASKAADERLILSIRHQPGQTSKRIFETVSQPELEQLCGQLQRLIKGTRS